MVLGAHTRLNEKYRIEKVLGQEGPFDTTYLATDLSSEQQVTVREYLPHALAERAADDRQVHVDPSDEELFLFGKKQFLKEGAVLRRLSHPNIVRELAAFEENGTAYRVAEFHHGATLATVLANRSDPLRLTAAFRVMKAIFSSLHAAHQSGLMHGGISPEAILLNKQGAPLLFSFRIARILLANELGSVAGPLSAYSAPEQATPKGKQGPWTDVYSSAAVLAYLLTGEEIPDSESRETNDVPLFEDTDLALSFREVLSEALSLDPAGRPRSIPAFKKMLVQAVQAVQQEAEEPGAAARPSADEASATENTAPAEASVKEAEEPQQNHVSDTRAESTTVESRETPELDAEKAEMSEPIGASDERPTPRPLSDDDTEDPAVEDKPYSAEETEAQDPAEPHPPVADLRESDEYDSIDQADDEGTTPTSIDERDSTAAADDDGVTRAGSDDEDMQVQEEPLATIEDEADELKATGVPDAESETGDTEEEHGTDPTRPEDRPPQARKNSSKKKVLISGIGAAFVLVLIGLAYMLTSSVALGTGGYGAPGFDLMKEQGDSLFAQGNYAQAATFYQQALMARPDDDYVSERLTESERRIYEAREAQFYMYLEEGDRLLIRADSLLASNDPGEAMSAFDEASRTYRQALPYRPDDPDLVARMDRASLGMNEAYLLYRQQTDGAAGADEGQEPEAVQEEVFRMHLAQAEEHIGEEDYEQARRRLVNALEIRPGDALVQERIEEVDRLIAEREEEAAFQRHVDRAEAMLTEGRVSEAIVAFDEALALRPDNVAIRARKAEAESRQAEEREREQQYSYFRAQGDLLQSEERYQEAIQSYRNALQFKTDDEYAQEQIRVSEQRLAEQEEAERRASLMRGDVYLVTDEPPQLIGGLSDLYSSINYPRRAREAGVQGRVYVQFVVNEDGRVAEPTVLRGIGYGCDEEAMRVIEQARFEPGRVQGQPVRAQHTLMIEFRLLEDDDEE